MSFLTGTLAASAWILEDRYWGLVYDGGDIHLISCFTHGVNFGVMLLDAFCSGFPLLLAHALYERLPLPNSTHGISARSPRPPL